jgi:O-antigen ligase
MWLSLATYLALVIIRPQEYLPELASLPILPIAISTAFIFWMFKPGKSFSAPQYLLVTGFVGAAIASRLAMPWLYGAWLTVTELGPSLALFIVLAKLAEDPRQLERLLQVFCVCALVLAVHGLDQIANGVGWTGQPLDTRSSSGNRIQYIGVFSDPNDLGMLFVMSLPLCLYLGNRGGVLSKVLWWSGGALLIVGTYLTNSRGALLALFCTVALWSSRRIGKVWAAVACSLLLPVVVVGTRLTGGIDVEEESAAGRVDAWYTALQLWEHNPLFGVGYGQFVDYNALTAHNSWLLALAETGLFGYVLWFTATSLSVLMLWKILSKPPPADSSSPTTYDRGLAGALFWSSCAMLIAALFLSRSYHQLFFLFWAWSAGHYTGALSRDPTLPKFELKSLAARWFGLTVASIFGAFVIVRILLVGL